MTNDTSMTEAEEARFWSKVDRSNGPDACWPWMAGTCWDGYGWFRLRGQVVRAHRMTYELANGAVPSGLVDHMCHNRLCVNPTHLRLATPGQNQANRRGATRNSRTGLRGVSPHGNGWQARVKLNGEWVYGATYATIWDADLAAILARASVFGPNAADRRILENADLLWGTSHVPTPSRPRRKGQKVA